MEIGEDPLAYPTAGLTGAAGKGGVRPCTLAKKGGGDKTAKRPAAATARAGENEGVRQGTARERTPEAVLRGVIAEKIFEYE